MGAHERGGDGQHVRAKLPRQETRESQQLFVDAQGSTPTITPTEGGLWRITLRTFQQ